MSHRLLHGCRLESVQTCLDGVLVHVVEALLHPELELVLSLGFLASLGNQPFHDCPKNLHWVDFGAYGGFCLLWHIRHEELVEQGSSWKCVMNTCKVWQEQNLVFSIYFINEGLQPVQANSSSLRTLMPASSEAPDTVT